MQNIKNISIKSFLAQRGVTPERETIHSGYYLSPLRSETTPSFHVSYDKNLWHDFGADVGGSIIDLVMQLDNCSVAEACRKLEGSDTLVPIERPAQIYKPKESPIKVVSVRELTHPHLLAYLSKRAINLDIAKAFCKEVHYTLYSKSYYAIGFGSDGGGWELRNSYYKGGTSPKSPTIVKGSADSTMLFEGFMDMLAYLTFKGSAHPVSTVCILNSVSNLRQATEFLKTQRTIYTFLDNDTAGCKALAEVEKLGVEVVNCSHIYAGHKDMNDYLIARNREPKQSRIKVKF
ncbi:MAG: toprim domain-containing protein [Rikenellaceae bacterium]